MKKSVSVAPMMDCTDRHDRYFLRLISSNVKLYTEMIVANAIIKGDSDFHLKFNLLEKPLALSLTDSKVALFMTFKWQIRDQNNE